MVYAKHLLQSNLINNLPTRFSLITLTGQHLVSRAERTQSSLEETSPPARLGHTFQADREFYATSDFIDRTSEPFVSVLSYKIGKYRCAAPLHWGYHFVRKRKGQKEFCSIYVKKQHFCNVMFLFLYTDPMCFIVKDR